MTNPRVFISYAHESAEHRAAVKSLADWLTEHGVETLTDHPYENRPPEIGWPAWMLHSVEDSDVVLVVCTPRLKARYEMREQLNAGLGATYEGAIVTQLIYNAAQRNTKFFPVLPDRGDRNNIPLELQRFDSGHQFPSGNERILRLITEEVQLPKPRRAFQTHLLGELRGPTDNRLVPQEGQVYGREPEVLRIVDFLRSADDSAIVCAHVTGTAGIGKTEVCKAALKYWLTETPQRRAFYVDLPDTAGPDELVYRIARALGAENVANFEDLRPLLRDGLYYLDNLEGVAEKREGQNVLKLLREHPGVRLLASSRIELPGELGKPIRIDALPPEAALQLFRDLWTGAKCLENSEPLRRFVGEDLGNHALSITLTARLGDSYAFPDLVRKWAEKGTALAADALQGDTRRSSLTVSLALTAESLRPYPGALMLWTLGAFFATGIDTQSLMAFEQSAALPDSVRQRLSRHHVWTLRDDRFRILPPIARYALDEAANERGGFSWNDARPHGFDYFLDLASRADSIASTDKSLTARSDLLARFGAIARMLEFESGLAVPRRDLLDRMNALLVNVYQFRAAQARELLQALERQLSHRSRAVRELGDLEKRLGRPEEARRLYDEALELFKREQDGLGQANTLKSLGDLEELLGGPEKARRLYGEALELFKREQARLGQANTLQSLGDLEQRLGRPEEARRLYGEALELFKREQDGLGQANTLQSLGDLEQRLRRLEEARRLYGEALELYTREQAGLGRANALRSLGDLEKRLGRPEEARRLYSEALALYKRAQDGLGQANTVQSLGDLDRGSDNMVAALRQYHEALSLYDTRDPTGTAFTWSEVARCHHSLGDDNARDNALMNAIVASQEAGVESVQRYVTSVLREVTGSAEASQAWLKSHATGNSQST